MKNYLKKICSEFKTYNEFVEKFNQFCSESYGKDIKVISSPHVVAVWKHGRRKPGPALKVLMAIFFKSTKSTVEPVLKKTDRKENRTESL